MTTDDDTSPVPLLDLAPKLDRPLSLLNPLDYLRLLGWVFFFPQALRWYVDAFGDKTAEVVGVEEVSGVWEQLQGLVSVPTFQRNLLLQGLLLAITTPAIAAALFQYTGIPVNWLGIVAGVAFGAALGMVNVVTEGVSKGVALGVAGSMVMGVTFGVALGMAEGVAKGVAFGVALGVAGGMTLGVALGVAWGVAWEVADGLARGLAGGVVWGLARGVVFGVTEGLAGGVAWGVAAAVTVTRLPDFIIALVAAATTAHPHHLGSRVTILPLPGLQNSLVDWLCIDPNRGVANLNEVLAYSLQFNQVIGAVNTWLAALTDDQLLPAAELLAHEPYDWGMIRYGSSSLTNKLRDEFVRGTIIIPKGLRHRQPQWFDDSLRFDTPARAACAGFWALHEIEMATAVQAFNNVRQIPGGDTLYHAVTALDAVLDNDGLTAIASWSDTTSWLATTPTAESESVIINVVRQLRDVSLEAAVASDSLSRLNRNAALSRAGAMLTHLLEELDETYPELIRPITRQIATQWRDILFKAGGEIGQLTIDRPLLNPYVVGNPVTGRLFAGRDTILRQLEELWGSDPATPAPSVVLYGHRRMGKTSILRNLGARFGRETVVVPFTMQRVGKVASAGELLHALALETRDALLDAGLPAPDEPDEAAFARNYAQAFNRFLRDTRRAIGPRRVILTIDEFEAIEEGIRDGRIDKELLGYLRGVIQTEPWLVLAFAGLHTLAEMTGDYWNPLFSSVKLIKVGFFSRATSDNLLANPHDDFPIDFTRPAAGRVYDHVRGQPYLTQLIGHTLVSRYNREMFEEGRAREPRFTAEEVDAVVASVEFYEVGDAYFSGIWGQADDPQAPGQHALLIALAQAEEPVAQAFLPAGDAALEALERHDVVARDAEGRIDFTVPLMRRWIRQNKMS